jgi:hypothetical protein
MYPKDVPLPPGEEWYYQLDGRVHGPMSRSDLEDLLDRSGETASDVHVRQGATGSWSPFRSASPASRGPIPPSTMELSAGRQELAGKPASPPLVPSAKGRGLGRFLNGNWDVGAAVGAWLVCNVLFFFFWPQSYSRERGYLQSLRSIEAEVQNLRAKPTSDAEWHEFVDHARSTLAPMVADLKKSASSSEPVRQQLLWAARDLVPHTLGPRTKERDEEEKRLKQYLDSAERELAGR